MNIYYWFLVFYLFSILGWVMESTYCFILDKKWVNRGFLYGPYCPIYGVGGLFVVLLLQKYYEDPLILFLLGMFICSVVEYITSYLLEKIFNDKWWDYSEYKYNLNGRICLKNSILFGISSLGGIYLIYPLINKLLSLFNDKILIILFIISSTLMIYDFITTICNIYNLKVQLNIIEKIKQDIKLITPNTKEIVNALKKYNKYPKRILEAFPSIKNKYEYSIDLLKKIHSKRK